MAQGLDDTNPVPSTCSQCGGDLTQPDTAIEVDGDDPRTYSHADPEECNP